MAERKVTHRKQRKAKMTVPVLVSALVAEGRADGWTVSEGTGPVDLYGQPYNDGHVPKTRRWVRFERTIDDGATASVTAEVDVCDSEYMLSFHGCTVGVQTGVNGSTFTRRGIDCYSAELGDTVATTGPDAYSYGTMTDLLRGQLARCERAHARSKTAKTVPGTNMTRQPEWFTQAAADLKAGKSVRLHPHGMGTGYVLSMRGSRFSARHAGLEAALGVAPVYRETFDAD